MLDSRFIKLSNSPYSSPVLLVKKKDGTALNAATIKDKFPIPTVDELLDELGHASWLSKLDLFLGFHQILMVPADTEKTAFRTYNGHFKFCVMPFSLCNALSTFQATMNDLFRPHLRRFIIVFFDDILVYSSTLTDHVHHLKTTFKLLLPNCFRLKGSKCTIDTQSIQYLGHVVFDRGVQPNPAKLAASLRGFLGLTGFYQKFVAGYTSISQPLTDLLKKDNFMWNENAQAAFTILKNKLLASPVLVLPKFDSMFIIQTDASRIGIEAVLSQKSHPIAYFTKQFCHKLRNSSTYIRELCAITSIVQNWRQYFLGCRFVIQIGQRSIKELLSQTVLKLEQQNYLFKLLGFDFEIQYRPDKTNTPADALSRIEDPNQPLSTSLLVLTIPQLDFLHDLKSSLQHDLPLSLSKTRSSLPHMTILIIRSRRASFSSRIRFGCPGHMGISRTLSKILSSFYWHDIRKDVKQFVEQCTICQQTKFPTQPPTGLLQLIPPPSHCWEDLSLDFIIGLPPYKNFTTILVVVDRFSKGAHFGMLPKSFTTTNVAQLFVDIVCKRHGLPRSLISDSDLIFLSQFWRDLFRLSDTKLRMSTAYHPQSDGQTEVTNKVLQHFNTSVNVSTGFTPFEVMFGRKPPLIPPLLSEDTTNAAAQSELSTRTSILQTLAAKLKKAQLQMKNWANKHRRDLLITFWQV
ncbi:hypothetical protein V8G54_028378 [Vigna mungo]|uniref:Integrase catalytic domain-containing protein n=1 Tax=Vigna mungo TaxID=3915 RepID=A0AAQ3MRV5_VIGMU